MQHRITRVLATLLTSGIIFAAAPAVDASPLTGSHSQTRLG